MKNPCYECRERTQECHSICERYKAWSEEIRDRREEIKAKKALFHDMESYQVSKSYRRMKK